MDCIRFLDFRWDLIDDENEGGEMMMMERNIGGVIGDDPSVIV